MDILLQNKKNPTKSRQKSSERLIPNHSPPHGLKSISIQHQRSHDLKLLTGEHFFNLRLDSTNHFARLANLIPSPPSLDFIFVAEDPATTNRHDTTAAKFVGADGVAAHKASAPERHMA